MRVEDVMTHHVITVSPNDFITRAVRVMLQNKISGLPVLDVDGRLVGMITEGDLLRRAETATQRNRPRWIEFFLGPGKLAEDYTHTHGRKVREVMSSDPVTVAEETPLEDVVALMEKHSIKRVPVIRGTKVVGIVSRANLLHALARLSGEAKPSNADDKSIREAVLAELKREKWAPVDALDIIVRNGVVDLWGSITDERERAALVVAAENIPGVKAVRDHLAWVDTATGMYFVAPEEPAEPALQ